MPTKPRIKIDHGIYHVVIKSVSDRLLFRSYHDKVTFMTKLKESQTKYPFKLYAYCLMDNHAHLLIDSQNQDISVVMKSLNLRYVKFYNFKYKLDSRLCKKRFHSDLIDSEDYLIRASLYIHRNPKDLPEISNSPHEYIFSSMSVYLGEDDLFEVLDTERILSSLNKNKGKAMKKYAELFKDTLMQNANKIEDLKIKMEFSKEEFITEKGILKDNYTIEQVVNFVAKAENLHPNEIHIKNRRKNQNARAMVTLLATAFCYKKCKEIATFFGSLTSSRVSQLGNKAISLILKTSHYKMLFENFIKTA